MDDFDERQDADADGWSLLTEYLQGTHPARPDALPASRIHGGDGASGRFGWTIGVRTHLPFAALRDGSLAAPLGLQREVVRGVEAWDGGASLKVLDAGPADASGLAPLLPGYQYRTFRLAEPRAAVGAGYLVRELHGK